jgi:16S rRNA (cytidine1402-2'-O)-methyltransferase
VTGAVVLVGTPIGNLGDLSPRAVEALRDADVVAAEDTRRTRILLSAAGVAAGGRLVSVREHNEAEMAERLVRRALEGARIAYVTDAGMPGISDPGERLVRLAVESGVAVEVVPGPSAALSALVVSGLPAGRFVFEGFLPRKGPERAARLRRLTVEDRTIVLFESPQRLVATLTDLAGALGPDRAVAVGRELTKKFETVWRGTLGQAVSATAGEGPEPRGEQVIVCAGAPEERVEPGEEEIREALRTELGAGASARDATDTVTSGLGVSRRKVYALAVALRQEGKAG